MNENKTERGRIIDKGNYGMYHKPLAQQIGLEAAVLMDFLIYKYDHFIYKKRKYKMIHNYKAFYITYINIEEATCIKATKLGRNCKSNPINILVSSGLISKHTIQVSHLKTTYYVLFFKNIEKAYDIALVNQSNKRKDKKKVKEEKVKSLLESDNRFIDNFLENNLIDPKNSPKLNDINILQIDSMETVETSSLMLQNKHITKNKITKNKIKKKKLTSEKILVEDSEFTDKELENMFDDSTNRAAIINSKIYDDEVKSNNELYDMYDLIKETRRGIITPKVFFNTIVNEILKDKFNGFLMSKEDELLIYDALINNPLFEFENEDIIARDNAIVVLKEEYNNITEDEILEEIEFDEDCYEHLYNDLWEKILNNCNKIAQGKLKARFGNIFVGIIEMSNNYKPYMNKY